MSSTQQEKDENIYNFSQLDKVDGSRPNLSNILHGLMQIASILTTFGCRIANTNNYGHAWIVYSQVEWTALGNANQVVAPIHPGIYNGNTTQEQFIYKNAIAVYETYKKHLDATVRMIIHVFGTAVFLTHMDAHGHLVGHLPTALFAHLHITYVTDRQKKNEITKIDTIMRLPYDI